MLWSLNNADYSFVSDDEKEIGYCERFVELMVDLVVQMPTRRFFLLVLKDTHLVVKCRLSKLAKMPEGK